MQNEGQKSRTTAGTFILTLDTAGKLIGSNASQ